MKCYTKKIVSLLLAAALVGNTALPVYAQQTEDDYMTQTTYEETLPEAEPETSDAEETESPAPTDEPESTQPPEQTEKPEPTETFQEPEDGEVSDQAGEQTPIPEDDQEQAASAEEAAPSTDGAADNTLDWYKNQDGTVVNETAKTITINKAAYLALLSQVDAQYYQDYTIQIAATGGTLDLLSDTDFQGLGSAAHPFQGKLSFTSGTQHILGLGGTSLFNALSDKAELDDLTLVKYTSNDNTDPLLAASVYHSDDGGNQTWNVTVTTGRNTSGDDEDTLVDLSAAGIVGTLRENAVITMSVTVESTAGFSAEGNAGIFCNTIESGATLQISGLTVKGAANVTGTKNAGGLVGYMNKGAYLTVLNEITYTGKVTASGGNAGGLIGYAEDIVADIAKATVNGATVSGSNTGGVVGQYVYSGAGDSTIGGTVQSVSLSGSLNAGGVVGLLKNTTADGSFTFKDIQVASSMQLGGSNSYGGLVGQYTADSLTASLTISGGTVTSVHYQVNANVGGLIGAVSGPAYVSIGGDVSVTANQGNNAPTNFGGLIGLSEGGSMLDIGSVTVTANAFKVKASGAAGGLVGQMNGGVLRLSGTCDLTKAVPSMTNSAYYGQLVGKNGDNSYGLIYALGNGSDEAWMLKRCASVRCSDIGNWGEVLRLHDADSNDQLEGLLTEDMTAHTVTVQAATASITSVTDFAAVALTYQLTGTGALKVTGGVILSTKLTLHGDIDLSGTGLLSFTRDGSLSDGFKGEFDGNGHTITLAIGETYGLRGDDKATGAGSGQLYSSNPTPQHNLLGLFGLVKGGVNIHDLTIAGGITFGLLQISATTQYVEAGAVAAKAAGSGTITVKDVTSRAAISLDGSISACVAAGGMFGELSANNATTLNVSGYSWTGSITDSSTQASCLLGGMIGFVWNDYSSIVLERSTFQGSICSADTKAALVGGVIAYIPNSISNQGKLTITDVTLDGMTIQSGSTSTTGGLLGYLWRNCQVTINGLTVKNCTLDGEKAQYGGLVYEASGYWSIAGNGVTFAKDKTANRFNGTSTASAPSALLVCRGDGSAPNNVSGYALYMEIGLNDGGSLAYTIESGAVSVGAYTYFDEIVGQTIGAKGNGIVSIATKNHALIDQDSCNTYTHQLDGDYNNPNTRYYYNLDEYRTADNMAASTINSEARMMLWSVKQYCANNLQSYFSTATSYTITGNILLSGYSYYPVTSTDAVTISNAAITFDYTGMNGKETAASNKEFSNAQRQHYEMQTGVFQNVGGSLSVANLTLAGTVGQVGGQSGALIRGTAGGTDTDPITLTINGVTLNGIALDGSTTTALLINKVSGYATLNMSGVKTTDAYTTGNVTAKVAGSLIGSVGSPAATGLYLTFSDMSLDAREDAGALSVDYGTCNSIFTNATLMSSFQAQSGGYTGVYNFEESAAAPTYGKELSDSVRNQDKQYWYYDTGLGERVVKNTDNFIPNMAGERSTSAFSSGYLPYVQNSGGKEGDTSNYHELDVNQRAAALDTGCGTYGHPYIITDGAQLEAVGAYLDSPTNDGANDLKIVVDTSVLAAQNGAADYHTADGKNDVTIVYDAAKQVWTDEDSGKTYDYTAVQLYLSNAHYAIAGEITLSTQFTGLGGSGVTTSKKAAMAFSGTIYGVKTNDSYPTVTVNVSGTTTQFGGLIKFSQGSVVKDLNLVYSGSVTITCTAAASNNSTNVGGSFFGGVVGYCLGGDTIIENVAVSGLSVDVSGSCDYLAAVGGYVGLVGGYAESSGLEAKGGGVIFRNITSAGLTNSKAGASSNYYYYNPYVGRVLDGYAASEGKEINNTDKNYTIPLLDGNADKLVAVREAASSSKEWAVTVNGAQSLWVLSAIVNSGAGCMDWYGNYRVCGETISDAYHYGKVRSGTESENYARDEQWWGGQRSVNTSNTDRNLDRVCYLIAQGYADKDASRIAAYPLSDTYSLTFTSANYDMTGYGNGFRGVGGGYSQLLGSAGDYFVLSKKRTSRTLSLNSINGNGVTITMAIDRKVYAAEENGMGTKWTLVGVGLFPVLNTARSSATTIQDITLSGVVAETVYDGTTGNTTPSTTATAAVGGLGGITANQHNDTAVTLTFKNITLQNLRVSGGQAAGGILGSNGYGLNGQNTVHSLVFQDCVYQETSVTADKAAGGFVGGMYATSNNGKLTVSYSAGQTPIFSGTVTAGNYSGASGAGVGGLVGVLSGGNKTITINGVNDVTMTMKNVTVQGTGTANVGEYSVGGLIGLCTDSTNTLDISNVMFQNVTVQGYDNVNDSWSSDKRYVGGVIGSVGGATTTTMTNISIEPGEDQTAQIISARMCGGLIGRVNSTGMTTIQNCTIRGESEENRNILVYNNRNGTSFVGGIVGSIDSTGAVTVKNSTVENIVVSAAGASRVGGIAGRLGANHGTKTVLNVADSTLRHCVVAGASDTGLLVGRIAYTSSELNGYNIWADDNLVGSYVGTAFKMGTIPRSDSFNVATVGLGSTAYQNISSVTKDSYTSGSVGLWCGGVNTSTSIKLVGVYVTGGNRPNRDACWEGNSESTSYIIYANHEGTASTDASFTTTDITTQPKTTVAGFDLNGDGAVPQSSGDTPVAKILAEYEANKTSHWNLMYGAAATALAQFSAGGDYASSLTTYDVSGENSTTLGDNNFAVLEISTTSASAATALVNSYISMVTNRVETAANHSYAEIEVTTYQWKDGVFKKADSNTMTWDGSSGLLRVSSGAYDNTKNQFTLLTVKYKNPTKSTTDDTDSYFVLQIPVLVKKVLRFTFHASIQSGTDYYAPDYDSLTSHVMASHGEQITALLSFDFDRTQEEWQAAVDNGDDLLWNFDMQVSIGTTALPNGTRLTLVDKNRGGLAYMLTVGDDTFTTVDAGSGQNNYMLALNKFSSITDTQSAWAGMLCDYLALTAKEDTAGLYVQAENADDATLRVGTTYYRLATDADTGTKYAITVGLEAAEKAAEVFYLTIQTPETTEIIVNNTITYPYSQLIGGSIPSQRSSAGQYEANVKNYQENIYIMGNFFTQTLSVLTTTDNEQLSTEANTITAQLTAEIKFSTGDAASVYKAYASQLSLYQSFALSLREYDAARQYVPANLASKAVVSVSYDVYSGDEKVASLEGGTVMGTQLPAVDIKPYVNAYGESGFKLVANVSIAYPDGDSLVMQFPERESGDTSSGISILGTSYIAYSQSASELAASSMRKGPQEDIANRHYYRSDVSDATLNYMAVDYDRGDGTGDVSELGINANDLVYDPPVPIESVAYYNVSNLSNITQAAKIHCELQLWQKDQNGDYKQVKASDYITDVTGYVSGSVTATAKGDIFTWDDDWSSDTHDASDTAINVDFSVKTGSAFESAGYTYANYRVTLAVSLLDAKGQVLEGTETSDYIIYTNARIYTGIIDTTTSTND